MALIWIYNEIKDPIIIEDEEFESYEDDNWYTSPINYVNIKDQGIDVDDPTAVQKFGEAIEGVVSSLNGALNIDFMDKDELLEFASFHHGCELDYSRREATLRKQTYALVYEDANERYIKPIVGDTVTTTINNSNYLGLET